MSRRTSQVVADDIQAAIDRLNHELRRAAHEGFRIVGPSHLPVHTTPTGALRVLFDPHVTGPHA